MSWSMTSIRDAKVDAADVYRFYADPTTWGDWGHNTKWGRPTGPVEPGAIGRGPGGQLSAHVPRQDP